MIVQGPTVIIQKLSLATVIQLTARPEFTMTSCTFTLLTNSCNLYLDCGAYQLLTNTSSFLTEEGLCRKHLGSLNIFSGGLT